MINRERNKNMKDPTNQSIIGAQTLCNLCLLFDRDPSYPPSTAALDNRIDYFRWTKEGNLAGHKGRQ